MKIIVLAGGLSPERDVSLSSGSLIANALMDCGHEVCLLDLYMGLEDGQELKYYEAGTGKRYWYKIPDKEPELEKIKLESGNGDRLIGKGVLEACQRADLVFIALHGAAGENGQIQAVLDSLGILYTGTGYVGCLLAMDKDLSKRLMKEAGIATPSWKLVDRRETGLGLSDEISFPCVVKPCSCGSSMGVTMADNREELRAAVDAAGLYEDFVLVEEKITGREFSVGILDGEVLPIIEIIPKTGFYDYKNKYQAGLTEEICPVHLCSSVVSAFQETALRVHRILRLGAYSRIDFMMDKGGRIYCLEANTLPGMTPASLLPQEARAAGISYEALCGRIVESAFSSTRPQNLQK